MMGYPFLWRIGQYWRNMARYNCRLQIRTKITSKIVITFWAP